MTKPQLHISGVGGVGMNAIAQLLLSDGYHVIGSDRFADQGIHLPVLDQLKSLGLELVPQDGSALNKETQALVISTAVEADNPERLKAAELNIPEKHRSEILAEFTQRGPLVAIAGTSGKTTCTAWLGWVLTECGLNINMVNGGGITAWKKTGIPGNVRVGNPESWWVAEVDESDGSLLRFHPKFALINTISEDHHSWEDTIELFRTFASQVSDTIICGPGVAHYLEGTGPKLIELEAPLDVPLPGEHNAWNAAAVSALANLCGIQTEQVNAAVQTFPGVERRLELCSPPGSGPRVYDDYAHNPEKLLAAIRAVQPETGKLTVLWRPHGFAPLKQNFDAFVEIFALGLREQDELLLLPVFYAGGTAPKGIGSEDLATALLKQKVKVQVLLDFPDELELDQEDVLLVAGARDPELPVFAHRMGLKTANVC